ncbi:MAG: hypothetical protein ACYTXT_40705 [Nostoc sp.]
MTEPILLFLDINGVIDVEEDGKTPEQISKHETGYPVPGAKEFLQVIDSCPWIHPMWISSWGLQSHVWNNWSKTRFWPVAYSLKETEKNQAIKLFPNASDKYLAVRWHSRDWQHRIVWIEDGFWLSMGVGSSMGAAVKWAEPNSTVQLIDTVPTIQQHRKGYKKGIRRWNIELICDALDIQENREILLNQIKPPISDLTDILSENIIPHMEKNQKMISNQINASTAHSLELLDQQVILSNNDTKKLENPTSFISKIRNLFKFHNRT